MIDKIIDSIIWYIPIKKLRNSIRELLLHYNSQIEDLKFNNYNTVKTLHNDINDNLHCIKDNLKRLQNSINDLQKELVSIHSTIKTIGYVGTALISIAGVIVAIIGLT